MSRLAVDLDLSLAIPGAPDFHRIVIGSRHQHFLVTRVEGHTVDDVAVVVTGKATPIVAIPQIPVLVLGATISISNVPYVMQLLQ